LEIVGSGAGGSVAVGAATSQGAVLGMGAGVTAPYLQGARPGARVGQGRVLRVAPAGCRQRRLDAGTWNSPSCHHLSLFL